MNLTILAVWLGIIVTTIALVGARELFVKYPELGRWLVKGFRAFLPAPRPRLRIVPRPPSTCLQVPVRHVSQRHPFRETGKETGNVALDDIITQIARDELSQRAERALEQYARTGAITLDTDVYALLGMRTETGRQKLAKIRERIAHEKWEQEALAREIARLRTIPHDPELERMVPLPQ